MVVYTQIYSFYIPFCRVVNFLLIFALSNHTNSTSMNYLAHLALSHDNSSVMLGNFIGDFVKGSNYSRYSPKVRAGILLHRKIDDFTDNHPIVHETNLFLKDAYGRYAGIITDMYYDHFLANNWVDCRHVSANFKSDVSLAKFVSRVHRIMLFNYFRLPGEVKRMLPFLIKSRRLENYANISGLARSLNIMARNTSLPANTQDAMKILKDNYDIFLGHFNTFYPQIQAMADEELKDIQPD